MIVYGISSCPDTREAVATLEKEGVPHEFRDFCKEVVYLKEFLGIRDRESMFDHLRGGNGIGMPCFVLDNGTITFDMELARGNK